MMLSLQPLIELLLGDVVSMIPPQDITFTARNPPADFTKLDIKGPPYPDRKPEMRKGCTLGWKKSSSLGGGTKPMDLEDLGEHYYGLPLGLLISIDKIGHIYTKFGGIVDLGHVRDHADITRYFASEVMNKFKNGGEVPFGDDTDLFRSETGKRIIVIKKQGVDPSPFQAAVIAAAISYDIAVWHEIATYQTWQDYSSFSPEDNFSNLLGAYLGFFACLTQDKPYNEAMSIALFWILRKLGAQPKSVTIEAVKFLKNKWYHYNTDTSTRPDTYLVLDKRHIETGLNENLYTGITPSFMVSPWLLTDIKRTPLPLECQQALVETLEPQSNYRVSIKLPTKDENGVPLQNYYSFKVEKTNNKDNSIFGSSSIAGQVNSSTLGLIVEEIRSRLSNKHRPDHLYSNANFDKPE
ncbi:DUF4056 domain-containing protein [uncultured Thiothrix sp.]|uniref:DUF4056 domain-containing protein n=1 Tax=uncultured Thiothrix sp. TaxID=223185 RepID=UPI002607FBB4|nr:DUF4056 domain-containing protein [uncultured Thiothrix sp.]HMT92890.1 DUF4056 domain-containing protein [Thiolinea sp.]